MKIMKIIAMFLLGVNLASAVNWDAWRQERQLDLKEVKELPEKEQIPRLGIYLASTGLPYSTLNEQQQTVVLEARNRLLKIPGHAEYYRDRIMEPYLAFREGVQTGKSSGRLNDYLNESMYGFATLSLLPSPETVRVLGEMFNEDWMYKADTSKGDDPLTVRLSGSAVAAMSNLPLVAAPASDLMVDWKQWYAEIKSGERSFAFIGQPVSYRFKLDGTVEETPRDASKDPIDPILKKRQEKRASLPAKEVPQAQPRSYLPWALIGGVVSLLGLVAFIKRREKHS